MASLSSLRDLAACWSIIFGKALSFEEALSKSEPSAGRPDFIDARTEQIRSALDALRNLQTLSAEDMRAAKIMMLVHVQWGEVARTLKDNWVELGAALREHTPKKRINGYHATLREQLYQEGLRHYHIAKTKWEKLS